jgi:hydroxymethylpyrimidine pyrophosphatase-like HAD family hydrolase
MRNPLLVSSLDGALLTSQKHVTERTAGIINRFVASGGLFSVATARMPYGCRARLRSIDLRIPAVVMNGAALYSFGESRYEGIYAIDPGAVEQIQGVLYDVGAGAFVYAVIDGVLNIGYTTEADLRWWQYNSATAVSEHGPFVRLGPRNWSRLGEIVYVAVVGGPPYLARAHEAIASVHGVRAFPYRNVYTETDCLELASQWAGKENALVQLMGKVPADGLVAFGDNYNDVGMMELAQLSYAPRNAVEPVRELADEVIPDHDRDGVASTIEARFLMSVRGGSPDARR